MLGTLANLPTLLLWLIIFSGLMLVAAALDRLVVALVARGRHKQIRGILPTVALPLVLLGLLAAVHLAYDGLAENRAATDAAVTEARQLREAANFSRSFDEPVRVAVLTKLRAYAERIIAKERAEMRLGAANPASGGGLLPILDAVMAYAPTTPGQRLAQAEVMSRIKAVSELRQQRLSAAARPVDGQRWGLAGLLVLMGLTAAALSHAEFPAGRRWSLAILVVVFGTSLVIAVQSADPYARAGLEPMTPFAAVLSLLN